MPGDSRPLAWRLTGAKGLGSGSFKEKVAYANGLSESHLLVDTPVVV